MYWNCTISLFNELFQILVPRSPFPRPLKSCHEVVARELWMSWGQTLRGLNPRPQCFSLCPVCENIYVCHNFCQNCRELILTLVLCFKQITQSNVQFEISVTDVGGSERRRESQGSKYVEYFSCFTTNPKSSVKYQQPCIFKFMLSFPMWPWKSIKIFHRLILK